MIQNVVENIGGVEVFGIISICLFFVVFTGMLIWALRLKKPFVHSMSAMALQESDSHTPEGKSNHE